MCPVILMNFSVPSYLLHFHCCKALSAIFLGFLQLHSHRLLLIKQETVRRLASEQSCSGVLEKGEDDFSLYREVEHVLLAPPSLGPICGAWDWAL